MAKKERKNSEPQSSGEMSAPNPTQETTQEPQAAPGPSLDQVIQESRATIQEEAQNPKKRKYKPRATAGQASPQARKPLDPTEVKALADLLTPVLAMPYEMAAQRSGVPELRCTSDELALQSDALAKVMIIMAPKMGEKEAAIFGALVAVGGVAMSKVAIYQDAKARSQAPQRPTVVGA